MHRLILSHKPLWKAEIELYSFLKFLEWSYDLICLKFHDIKININLTKKAKYDRLKWKSFKHWFGIMYYMLKSNDYYGHGSQSKKGEWPKICKLRSHDLTSEGSVVVFGHSLYIKISYVLIFKKLFAMPDLAHKSSTQGCQIWHTSHATV